MNRRRAPRTAAAALHGVLETRAPKTRLAAVQSSWEPAVGPTISAEAQPVAEREGVVTVTCRSATWAQELDLMQEELLERLNGALSEHRVEGLRFTADAARHDPRVGR
jgi:predicted nucleic acid-binding Zn ribbon protein